jgi:intermediate cleaving peptidase 55
MKGAAMRSARAHAKVRIHYPKVVSVSNRLQTMRFAHPGVTESDIEAYFQYACAYSYDAGDGMGRSGCERPAYVPVVASGSVITSSCTFKLT